MPSALPSSTSPISTNTHIPQITKFTNCRLLLNRTLITQDLWVSSLTGKILHPQEAFYAENLIPDTTIDLGGLIISPGFIDVQLNGAFGFDFASGPEDVDATGYAKNFRQANKLLVKTGVTSYLPTITSSTPEVYHHALPFLGPSGGARNPFDGAESLGAHVEGPFLSPTKNGIHPLPILQVPTDPSLSSISSCYGSDNLSGNIRLITAAPELPHMLSLIPTLVSPPHNLVFSIGHTEATYEEATLAIEAGATMITHLFNAMRPLHHRNPGIFGLLGVEPSSSPSPPGTPRTAGTLNPAKSLAPLTTKPHQPPTKKSKRPYFGIIADGIHLHPTTITLAYNAHPSGLILVTDAMHLVGLPDGLYPWKGTSILKRGNELTLVGEEKIAGSSATLLTCVNNFLGWTGCSVAKALGAVTETPARLLGLFGDVDGEEGTAGRGARTGGKGSLEGGMDADLCILREVREGEDEEGRRLVLEQVWKWGVRVA